MHNSPEAEPAQVTGRSVDIYVKRPNTVNGRGVVAGLKLNKEQRHLFHPFEDPNENWTCINVYPLIMASQDETRVHTRTKALHSDQTDDKQEKIKLFPARVVLFLQMTPFATPYHFLLCRLILIGPWLTGFLVR